MALANQEAQRLNHEYVGTEHILLGLAKEGTSTGYNILKNLGSFDSRTCRIEVEKIVKRGPDMVTMGKLPQTPKAKRVIEYAIDFARERGHNYVGSEHLVEGLLQEEDGVAFQVLTNMEITRDKYLAGFDNYLQSLREESAEQPQEQQRQEPAHWVIPRSAMCLADVVKEYGFETKPNESGIDIVGVEGLVGRISEQGRTVNYQLGDLDQIKEALVLRNAYKANGVPFTDVPPVAEVLNHVARQANDLRDVQNQLRQ